MSRSNWHAAVVVVILLMMLRCQQTSSLQDVFRPFTSIWSSHVNPVNNCQKEKHWSLHPVEQKDSNTPGTPCRIFTSIPGQNITWCQLKYGSIAANAYQLKARANFSSQNPVEISGLILKDLLKKNKQNFHRLMHSLTIGSSSRKAQGNEGSHKELAGLDQ